MPAIWPSAVATTLQMLLAINNTKVTLNVDAGIGDTTLTVDDASPLSTSGFLTFDDNSSSPETVSYTGKSGNDLTGVARGADGTAAGTHVTGSHLEMRWNAAYHNTLATELIAVEQNLSDRFGTGTNIVVPAARTFTLAALTNQLILGATRTVTINAPTPASSSRIWTIPDISAAGTFAALEGTQVFSGAKTFSAGVAISATTNQLILGTTNTITITAPAPSASRTYTIPDAGGAATFIMSVGTATLSLSTSLTVTGTTNQIILGTTNTVTISSTAPAASRTYTIPDAGGAASFVMTAGTQTIAGAKTFSSTLTMSGATIAMGGNKITGIANGTAATDAMAFGQQGYFQTVYANSTAQNTTSSGTFIDTGLSASITPQSTSRVRIQGYINVRINSNNQETICSLQIVRGASTVIYTITNAGTFKNLAVISDWIDMTIPFDYVDSPATSSSTTYKVQFNANSAGNISTNPAASSGMVMVLTEIV